MSLFLSVNRFQSQTRYFNLRGPYGSIGESRYGIFGTHNLQYRFMTFAAVEDHFVAFAECPGITMSYDAETESVPLQPNRGIRLPQASLLKIQDYSIKTLITNPSAEVLATTLLETTSCAQHLNYTPAICAYNYGYARRSLPLYSDMEIEVGSSSACQFQIDQDNIQPLHCSLTYSDGRITVTPRDGVVSVHGRILENSFHSPLPITISLEPLGIELRISV